MKKQKHNYSFIRFPRAFTEDPIFRKISIDSRILLALIFDRSELSEMNAERFTDKNGEIFVIYTVEEVCKNLKCGKSKALRMFKELEQNNMILRKRTNGSRPSKIYITPLFINSLKQDLAKYQNQTLQSAENNLCKTSQSAAIKNNNINNDNNNTHSSTFTFARSEDEICEQIEYECIVCDSNRKLLDEIVMIICDILNGTSPTVRIGKDDMPRNVVVSRFLKLDSEYVLFVISQLENNTQNIKNIKPYIVTLLYNAPATMESTVTAEFAYHNRKI